MAYYVKLYLITLAAFFAIDMVWLGLVARGLYSQQLGYLLAAQTNWLAAILFYLLFVLGVVVFVVLPGLSSERTLGASLLRAALFGLITYATYDLTNLATVRDWPLLVTVIDMVWGTVLSLSVSYVGLLAGRWLR
jgi:uncharacterized membrane protein